MGQAVNTFLASRVDTLVGARADKIARKRRMTDAIIIMIILAVSAICLSFYARTSAELAAAKAKRQASSEKIEALKIQNERLEREIRALQSDKKKIEEFARHYLGLVRAGDVVVKVE
ncbi:MAG: septum formation initiator family protein [Acidobacteriota bacterium]